MPRIRIGPPLPGRTARRRRATRRSARDRRDPLEAGDQCGAPTSTAAASAEPPPRPAPIGIPLRSSMRDVRAERRRAARIARLLSPPGTPAPRRTGDQQRRRDRGAGSRASSWGSLTDDDERVELVVPVGTRADDLQRERELRERVETRTAAASPVVAACASAAHCASSSVSARAAGSMPAIAQHRLGIRSPSSALSTRRSILRRVANPARTSSNMRSGSSTATGGSVAPVEAHERADDLRLRDEHVGGTAPTSSARA